MNEKSAARNVHNSVRQPGFFKGRRRDAKASGISCETEVAAVRIAREKEMILEAEQGIQAPGILQGKKDYVNFVKAYVADHYRERLCLKEIAEKMNLSRSYLSTVFNQMTGCSFQDYTAGYRIKKATELLKTENMPLCILAELVGYEDYAHFSKVFKRKTGVSPKQYINWKHFDMTSPQGDM